MRATLYRRYGAPADVLECLLVDEPPAPAAGEVTVRVLARPVHHGDLLGIAGRFGGAALPSGGRRIGFEGAGMVEAVGAGVTLLPGTRVAFFPGHGAWAERVTVSAAFVTAIPDDIGDDIAAQLHVNPLTAILLVRAAIEAGALAGRTTVLTAAGSSVAKLAATLLIEAGAKLVGLVRSPEAADALRVAVPGVAIISTAAGDWPDALTAAAGAEPIGVVLDAVGGSIASTLLGRLASGGTLISYGDLSGEPITATALWFSTRSVTIRGVTVGSWGGLPAERRAEDMAIALRLAQSQPALFPVAARYDLAQVAAAAAHVDRAGKAGTVLLISR